MPRREAARLPAALWPLAGIAVLLLVLPLVALLIRVPWRDAAALLTAGESLEALTLSLGTALAATGASLLLGVPLAAVLAGSDGWAAPVRRLLRAAVTVPLVLPPVVAGIALLLLLGRQGVIGAPLAALTGVTVPFTTPAVVIAQTFVSMPFLVLAVEGALRGADPRYAVVAASLGASRWHAFRRVTLPLVAPGLLSGAVLCFTRALGEFGATITFAGSFPGVTRTLPIAAYLGLQASPESAIVLALLLLVVSVVVLVSLRDKWLRVGS
ncbi:molybdate ABC transporter permease subunit [Naasia sp. SYSU D00948]|uniref:molybdate ABC transporter permease subunit n=1 Tax=Naasia sp. SYSU D00948 TaxID=2817379 RepID=UPI001FEEB449|nr:molybdate ABC transporter permease subunit [Naasia sp. SYSU D00948]